MKELCPYCKANGNCWFERRANQIASGVKDSKDKEQLLDDAINASFEIMLNRIEARKKMCPNLNDINPDYPGKRLL